MNSPARHPQQRCRPVAWPRLVSAGLLALGIATWCGCAVTRKTYPTLSFFFDGVPDPAAPGPGGSAPGDTTVSMAVLVHRPYAEEKCDACHKTQYRPSRNDPSACLSCHDKAKDEHQWTHGAVAGGACLWCHAPHESARKWLLRGPDRNICVQCHSATMMHSETVPAHADPKRSCLECHLGHGGETSLMLRPGATRIEGPTSPPSESPTDATPATPTLPDIHTEQPKQPP